VTDEFRASTGDALLVPTIGRRSTRGGSGFTASGRDTMSDKQAAAVGLVGEVAALEWLKARYKDVDDGAWVSGYRNLVFGDGLGDDTLGYDLVVERRRHRLFFEVKSASRDSTEFVLTANEIAKARSLRKMESYHLLYVAYALDSKLRRIHELPNPLDPAHAHFFRSLGEGMRYRFDLRL
jgi:hypothetical protein